VALFKRELTGAVGPSVLVTFPFGLLPGTWLGPRTGFMPVLRTRLPELSLVFVMPFCAFAEAAHANMQRITIANFMYPRFSFELLR
jgi:hypothetical protein